MGVSEPPCGLYDAKIRGARLARLIWHDPALADKLESEAIDLKRRFNHGFWIEDRQHYALGLDVGGILQWSGCTSSQGCVVLSGVEFRVLGPVEVIIDGTRVEIGHAKRRAVLAALLLDANRVLPDDELVSRVWGTDQPRSPRNVLSGYLTRLRGALAGSGVSGATVRLSRRSGGYLAELDPELVDVHEFRRLVGHAQAGSPDTDRATLFHTALQLWRGVPLSGVDGAWVEQVREALSVEWLAARMDAVDVELRLGRHAGLIAPLLNLVERHPLHERLVGQLMQALHRSGRAAEALEHYARAQRRLTEALGVDPGPQLRELHRQVLRGDLAPHDTTPAPARSVPAQLPHDARGFAGRDAELTQLAGFLPADPPAVVIVAISGTAGVGKTSLAIHWGGHIAQRFPDGQLYLDLCGFHPHLTALAPMEALGRFLTALGVDPRELPPSADDRAALYRSLLASRQMLVLLDNARDAAQVRPLLPGGAGNLVIVTSRVRLDGLVALDGAHPLALGALTEAASRDLLSGLLGRARVAADAGATAELARLCAYLPLALRLSAAWLLVDPERQISEFTKELTQAGPLVTLCVPEDTHASIAAAFDLSYRALGAGAQRLFRLLGLLPVTDWSTEVAGALLDVAPAEAARLLDALTQAHLVERQPGGRYRMHDLLHRYAADRAAAHEPEPDRRAALARGYDWYVRTLAQADDALFPGQARPVARAPEWAESVLVAERDNVRALIERAHETAQWAYVWRLALSMSRFQEARSDWEGWAATHRLALDAARRCGDLDAQARVLSRLGEYFLDRREREPAVRHLNRALTLHRARANPSGEADALRALGDVHREQGELDAAGLLYQQALPMVRPDADARVECEILRGLGIVHRERGHLDAAAACLERAVEVAAGMGDRRWEAIVRRSLGLVYRDAGRWDDSRLCYEAALTDLEAVGDRLWQAYTLNSLSDILNKQGKHGDALAASERALRISRHLHSRSCEGWAQLSRGMALHGQGSLPPARDTLADCLGRFADLADPRLDASALHTLGLVHRDTGDVASARDALRRALRLFEELGIAASAGRCSAALQALPPDD